MAELYYGNKKVLGIKPPGEDYISLSNGKKVVGYIVDIPDGTVTLTTDNEYYGPLNDNRIYKVNLPDSLQSIGAHFFSGMGGLTSIDIPEGVTVIGDNCFDSCSALKYIKLPSTLKQLGQLCFNGVQSLQSIQLPDSLEVIGDACFYICSSLKSITIPEHVTYLGNIFGDCGSMESIVIKGGGDTLTIGELFLNGIPSNVKVYFEGDPPLVSDDAFKDKQGLTFYYKADNANWTSDITTPTWGGATEIKWATY
jgi:hypothetical protein